MKMKLNVMVLCFLSAGAVMACSVPVFRYALERWQPDGYMLVVARDKPLTEAQQKTIDSLNALSLEDEGFANIYLSYVNMKAEKESPILKYLPEEHPPYPAMFLFYPRSFGKPKIIWQGEVESPDSGNIVESKLRKEISAEILRGRTAVWLFLESGNKDLDDKAHKVLKDALAEVQNEAELPAGVATASGDVTGGDTNSAEYIDPINQLKSAIPLQISFSIIRVSRSDKDETFLLSMLSNMEPDLKKYAGEPMVYPVFGRGRVLEPLVGKGINEENIFAMSQYLCGPCSCQIKAQNPGVDLLFNIDWDAWVGQSQIEERTLPPLSGLADIIGAKPEPVKTVIETAQIEVLQGEPEEDAQERGSLRRNLTLAFAAILIMIVAGTAVMLRKDA